MFERFTERARRAIFHAKYEALARGSNEIEPKDIVLGLTWDPHQPGCPFAKIHDDADELRRLIGTDRTVYGPPKIAISGCPAIANGFLPMLLAKANTTSATPSKATISYAESCAMATN